MSKSRCAQSITRVLSPTLIAPLNSLVLEANLVQQATSPASNVGLVVEDLKQALPDLTRLLAGIDGLPDAGLLVVVDDGRGLSVICHKALLEGLGVVVGALDEGLAGNVINHGLLGGVEDLVVGAARRGVHETASDTRHKERVVDLKLNSVLEGLVGGLEHAVELLGLDDCSWETVEDEAARHVVSNQ